MEEERIGLFVDYENLAIGARDDLGIQFDFKPIADALAERGRVVVRRAYADWSAFEKDRQMLADNQVEMIEIPRTLLVESRTCSAETYCLRPGLETRRRPLIIGS